MPQETKVYRPTPTNPTKTEPQPQPSATDLVEEIDDFLDEVDTCLEENALETLRTFVQRGGQ